MKFVTGLTGFPAEMRRYMDLWDSYNLKYTPFDNVIITPLFSSPGLIDLIKEKKREGYIKKVFFDSGGFQCQLGKITWRDLCDKLYACYIENDWADHYILPDHVPMLSTDGQREIWEKVIDTLQGGYQFYHRLPGDIQKECLPVIQGRTTQQIWICIQFYRKCGFKYFGFGGVGTFHSKIKSYSIEDSRRIIAIRKMLLPDETLHVFGVGSLPMFSLIKDFASTDSASWIRKGINDMVSIPLGGAVTSMEYDKTIKPICEHYCPFCQDLSQRDNRILHNLYCICETLELLEERNYKSILKNRSPKMFKLFQSFEEENNTPSFFVETEKFWECEKIIV